MQIGGLGELVRFIRPPVTGRSASSRLRFRFVPCVRCVPCERARRSCAGACGTLFLSLGLPGARIHVLCVSAPFGVNVLCAGMWVLRAFDRYSSPWADMLLHFAWVLRTWLQELLVFAWVLRGTTLKPMQIAASPCEPIPLLVLASPC